MVERHRRGGASPDGTESRHSALGRGSVSLRLYPHQELEPSATVETLLAQGEAARRAGFDGVMTSEHHNGFAGYLPNPLQTAGWLLERMDGGWAAPCPLLLTLRPASLVVEEAAWLAARFPGRLGLGVAAGSLPGDFEVMGLSADDLTARFAEALAQVAGALSGREAAPLEGDPAVARCRRHPIPVVSAAMSTAAVRRAAAAPAGILLDSLSGTDRCRHLVDAFRAAGGVGPVVLVRRAWLGRPPTELSSRQRSVYEGYADPAAVRHWSPESTVSDDRPEELAARLAGEARAAGAEALNLRLHLPGISPGAVGAQIEALEEVLPTLRRLLAS